MCKSLTLTDLTPASATAAIMRPRLDVVRVLARLASWFLLLLVGLTADLTSLAEVISRAPVIFPSDAALRIELPEWRPRDRDQRDTRDQWTHKRPALQIGGGARRGEVYCLCYYTQYILSFTRGFSWNCTVFVITCNVSYLSPPSLS